MIITGSQSKKGRRFSVDVLGDRSLGVLRRGPRTDVLDPRALSLQDMPQGILDLLEGTHPHPTPPPS